MMESHKLQDGLDQVSRQEAYGSLYSVFEMADNGAHG